MSTEHAVVTGEVCSVCFTYMDVPGNNHRMVCNTCKEQYAHAYKNGVYIASNRLWIIWDLITGGRK